MSALNTGEYTSTVLLKMLGDMEVTDVPIVPYNSEENGMAERFNQTVMKAVRAAPRTTQMSWHSVAHTVAHSVGYWTWTLEDATDKYDQLPHSSTGKNTHEIWFNTNKLCSY